MPRYNKWRAVKSNKKQIITEQAIATISGKHETTVEDRSASTPSTGASTCLNEATTEINSSAQERSPVATEQSSQVLADSSIDDETFCEEQLLSEPGVLRQDIEPAIEVKTATPESLKKLLQNDDAIAIAEAATSEHDQEVADERVTNSDTLVQSLEAAEPSPVVSPCQDPADQMIMEEQFKVVRGEEDRSSKTDFMQPINLESPRKKDQSRVDSAYFSAAESPESTARPAISPRRSVAFASLPPRQPFAKKSMGPRSSHSRSSTFDSSKSQGKSLASNTADTVKVKTEPQSTPQISSQAALLPTSPLIKRERLSLSEISTTVLAATHEPEPIYNDAAGSMAVHKANTKSDIDSISDRPQSTNQDMSNPFVISDGKSVRSPEPTQATPGGPITMPESIQAEDDDWLPRYVGSPKRGVLGTAPSHIRTTETGFLKKAPNQIRSPTKLPALQPGRQRDHDAIEKTTPSAIRAAMQAASAKATSYLRQARTAFGSPSANHTKVFHSTTPFQSPPKLTFKPEPQTPKLYPDIPVSQFDQKPSMIPSKTPRKTPARTETVESTTPRRSPRRSPKKGFQASQSMAVMAARSATLVAHKDRGQECIEEGQTVEKDLVVSPKKTAKVIQKFTSQLKAKPLSIRVATASQREFENTKDRKMQPPAISSQSVGGAPNLSRSTSESAQLDYLSKSQAGTAKRVAPSRQIKALAAATQAKEKAEKEQERREQLRKEMERKRQENARRQADEEERRKAELSEENKKRKAIAETKSVSAKKQVRPMTSKSQLRETPMNDQASESGNTKPTLQPLKRALPEVDEASITRVANGPEVKRRCTEEQYERASLSTQPIAPLASKPIRMSLQKKSLFGHPGEPGYKKPGTTTFNKSASTAEPIKFSTEPIRFSNHSNPMTAMVPLTGEGCKAVNLPPSELIELPEINSDYSDSDDDEPPQKDGFERPAWANTPELRKLLRRQQRIDPDDVFGPIQPLQMEEIFKGKERALARFRPRSSSANWSGNDKLTAEEVTEYAKVMGYKN